MQVRGRWVVMAWRGLGGLRLHVRSDFGVIAARGQRPYDFVWGDLTDTRAYPRRRGSPWQEAPGLFASVIESVVVLYQRVRTVPCANRGVSMDQSPCIGQRRAPPVARHYSPARRARRSRLAGPARRPPRRRVLRVTRSQRRSCPSGRAGRENRSAGPRVVADARRRTG
jgi:hypothetical protein